MEIESIIHKGLREFAEKGRSRHLVGNVDRIRKMLAYIVAMQSEDELETPPNYGAHQLTGDRKGTWSLAVTRNWRMTFRIENGKVIDMDLEDYH